jgi:hypothetical protein
MIKFSRHISVLCLTTVLTNCGGGVGNEAGGGGSAMGDLSGVAGTVFGAVALQSKERIMLKQNLNQLSMKISILASSSPSQIQSSTRAQAIASALQGVANNLVGVMPRNIDVQKFSQFSNMIGPQYWQYAFVPVVTAQMIQFQAAYLNLLLQYMAKAIEQLREADVKNLLAVLETSTQSLAGVAV